jgi:hypothetical protein
LNFPLKRSILNLHARLSAGLLTVIAPGWRRDEWAERPLFICGKMLPGITDLKDLRPAKSNDFPRPPERGEFLTRRRAVSRGMNRNVGKVG